jgi:hypothetical protein
MLDYANKELLRRIAAYIAVGFATYFAMSLMTCDADAMDLGIISLNELAVDYRNYAMVNPNGHEPMTFPDPPKESLNLEMKLDVLGAGYFDPTVESMTTDAQFRDVGLLLRLGIRITDNLEVGLIHHSQHQLDREQQLGMGHFPESDAFQVKLYLYRAQPSGRGSLF